MVDPSVTFRTLKQEDPVEFKAIMALIERDLSEPYSIFTYRYFVTNWPHLCHVAVDKAEVVVGVIVGRADHPPSSSAYRGYIAMLAVDPAHRRAGIGTELVRRVVECMVLEGVDEIALEAEHSNAAALSTYSKFGFVRDKRLANYYLNGSDAFRLKLWLR